MKTICNRDFFETIKGKIKCFVFDFDGTIASLGEPSCKPLDLVAEIDKAGKFVGIVTASGASALKGLATQINDLHNDKELIRQTYLGVANGSSLYVLDGNTEELYNFSLSRNDISNILNAWKKVMKTINLEEENFVEKGITTFGDFLKREWGEYISKDLLDLARVYNGKCFIEDRKVSFVMPKNEVFAQNKFTKMIEDEINLRFGEKKIVVDMGDATFAHATLYPRMSPKLFALRRIQSTLDLKDEEIAIFGDMPDGNDRGLLIDSGFPYTFTNKNVVVGNNPPFVLSGSELAPIASVYKAVYSLIKE